MKHLAIIVLICVATLSAKSQLIPVVEDGKVGYIDLDGKTVIPHIYDTPFSALYKVYGTDSFPYFQMPQWAYFSEGKATVRIAKKFLFVTYGYKYAVIDEQNNLVFEETSDIIGSFKNGRAAYRNLQKTAEHTYGERFGVINDKGELIIQPEYDYVGEISDGVALALQKDKYGYISPSGELIIPFKYSDAGAFSSGLAPAEAGGLYGYIDITGNYVIPPKYKHAWTICEGIGRYFDGYSYGYIKVEADGNYNKITKLGQAIYPIAGDFSEGLAYVQEPAGLFGYIDKSGNYAISPKFAYASSFSDGLAVAQKDNLFGYIDKHGNFQIQPEYDFASDFSNGVATVWKSGFMYFINKQNKKIYQASFQQIK